MKRDQAIEGAGAPTHPALPYQAIDFCRRPVLGVAAKAGQDSHGVPPTVRLSHHAGPLSYQADLTVTEARQLAAAILAAAQLIEDSE